MNQSYKDYKAMLTKFSREELAQFIIEKLPFLHEHGGTERRLLWIRWQLMSRKGLEMMDASIARTHAAKNADGSYDREEWLASHRDFEKASEMCNRADRLYQKLHPEEDSDFLDDQAPEAPAPAQEAQCA